MHQMGIIAPGALPCRLQLLNWRQDMRIVLMRGGLVAPSLAAAGPVIRLANPSEPLHGHLALTGNPR